jgi:tRNA1(Val) A37 N6-methylase TrmN6
MTAVEIDPRLCALAGQNAARNGFAESFKVVNADVGWPAGKLRAAGLIREGYDQVIVNPPFHAEGAVRQTPDEAKAAAHVMRAGGLGGWMRFLATMAAPKGRVTLIHRPDSLGELLEHLEGRFGDIAVFPLFPKRGEPAVRIILQARKGSRAGLKLLQGLVLHEADGSYTDAAEAVLRGGEALAPG